MPVPPPQSDKTSSNIPHSSGSSGSFTTYQPPPSRSIQVSNGLAGSGLGASQFLELEPGSPSTSTLVGSPMTPRPDNRPFVWNASAPSSGQQQPSSVVSHLTPSPSLGRLHGSDEVQGHHASAARTLSNSPLGSQNSRFLSSKSGSSSHAWGHSSTLGNWDVNSSSSHISVAMDDISLDNFTPADSPYPAKKEPSGFQRLYKKASMARGGNRVRRGNFYNRDGATTPQSEFGQSSNNSIITLLAQTGTMTANSSSTTLLGSFGFKKGQGVLSSSSSDGSLKGKSLEPEAALAPPQPKKQTVVTIGADGKAYISRPKAKKFGAKGKGKKKDGGGDGGNADRKSLFSNERLFIHWIKLGILLGTLGLTLCNFGSKGSLAFYIGVLVLLVAMSALGYAATSFHRRDRSLSRRLQGALARKQAKREAKGAPPSSTVPSASTMNPHEICYYDRVGPTVFCTALFFAYCLNFYLSVTKGESVNAGGGLGFFHVGFTTAVVYSISVVSSIITKKIGSIRDPLQTWEILNNVGLLPIRARAWIFSTLVGIANPYSRSLNFRITELRKGKACGVLRETKEVSNPFHCVHAGALVTFGETVGSLALFTLLGKKDRAILTNINAEYVKVSRGLLTASSLVSPIKDRDMKEMTTHVLIKNASFETVVKLTLTWKVDLGEKP
ncbi:hypothetical protein BGZ94_008641 [Podila epigama]|nr:hypothetical protein BGZ94_008641 [Podila epigama]